MLTCALVYADLSLSASDRCSDFGFLNRPAEKVNDVEKGVGGKVLFGFGVRRFRDGCGFAEFEFCIKPLPVSKPLESILSR